MSIHFAQLIWICTNVLAACMYFGTDLHLLLTLGQTCNSTTSCAPFQLLGIYRDIQKNHVSAHIQTACNTYCMMMLIQRIKQEIPASVHAFVHHSQKSRTVLMAKARPHLLSHTKIRLECQCDTCLMGYLESRI